MAPSPCLAKRPAGVIKRRKLVSARTGPPCRLEGRPRGAAARKITSTKDDAETFVTAAVGTRGLSGAFRVLRVAVPFGREACSALIASTPRASSFPSRDVRARITLLPLAEPMPLAPSPGAAGLVHAVAVGVPALPDLPGHGARRKREVVHVTVAKTRMSAKPADDLPAGFVASRGRVNAVADRVVPTRPADSLGIISSSRRASGRGPGPLPRKEEGAPLTETGPP